MSLAAVAAVLVVGTWVWVVGSSAAMGRPAAERVALGLLAACALAWTAMLAGAFGIAVLGSPWPPAAAALAIVGGLTAVRRPKLAAPRPALAPLAAGLAGGAIVAYPGLRRGLPELWPSHGDMVWHTGWIRQLLGGFSHPGGIYADEPSGYPWLFHALAAWIAQALPGGVADAIAVLEALALTAAAVGSWLLARELTRSPRAAAWAVGLFVCAAGFGWTGGSTTSFEFHMQGRDLGPFHGDPVPATSPSLAFIAPTIPRDLGIALTPLVLWLARVATRRREAWWVAGAATGLVFLIAPPAGIFCGLWIATLAVYDRSVAAWRSVAAATVVAGAWIVPLAADYHRYHGFVSITRLSLLEPTLAETIVATGVALPLAVAGVAVLWAGDRRREAGLLLVLSAVPAVAIAVAAAVSDTHVLGTLVSGNGTPPALVRWLRYVPYLVLSLCPAAGFGADAVVRAAGRRVSRAALPTGAALVVAVAGSTVLAADTVARTPYPHQLECTALPVDSHDTIAVVGAEPGADNMAMAVFARTGAAMYFVQRKHVKVRFRTWLDERRPGQRDRHRALQAFAAGAPPPPGVDILVVRRNVAARLRLVGVATCTLRGTAWVVSRAR